MNKRLIIVLSLMATLLLIGCSNNLTNPVLEGFYQSEMKNGYHIQFSFASEDKSFVAYINNIEINKGMYESLGDGKYTLKGDIEELDVKLDGENWFNLDMEKLSEKLNEGKPIQLKNVDKTPAYFGKVFSDQEKEDIQNLLK